MATLTFAAATVVKLVSTGLSAAGAISASGLEAGDTIVKIIPDGFEQGFEAIVSTANELQQLANLDWSSVNFTFYLLRGV